MKKWILPLAVLGCFSYNSAIAAIWFVNERASGAQTGTSWADAFTNLQPAIDAAASGDTIWVANGIYRPTVAADRNSTNDRDKAFVLKSNLHLFGGFVGTESKLSDRRDDGITTLEGNIGAPGDATDNTYHIVMAIDISNFTVDKFHLRGGYGNDTTSLTVNGKSVPRHYGSAIYNNDASGTYSNLLLEDNLVSSPDDRQGGGGAMFNQGGNITVKKSTFQNNKANNCNGGAMLNESSSPIITDVLFKGNEAGGSDEGGGAIDNRSGSNAVFTNVIFDGNTATHNSGGGVYNDGSSPTFTDVVFKNNHAGGSGGGLDCDGGSNAILNNVQFINNSAEEDGGGLYGWKSNITLNKVTFSGNHADNNGGGMYNYNTCNPVLTNVTFENNTADNNFGGFGLERDSKGTLTNIIAHHNKAINNGGGIGATGTNTTLILTNILAHHNKAANGGGIGTLGSTATIILTNGTLVNNNASVGGGGYDHGTTSQIRNSIIIGNYPDNIDANNALMGLVKHSIIEDAALPVSPALIKDGSNPASSVSVSWPFFVDTAAANYQLIAGSDAIDAGDSVFYNTGATPDLSTIVTDLKGADRTIGSNTDIGAYEVCTDTVTLKATLSATPGNTVTYGTTVTFTLDLENEGNDPQINWYKNSTLIANASGTVYTAIAGTDFGYMDTIYALVYSSNGCAYPDNVTSNKEVMMLYTGIGTLSEKDNYLSLYPNPNHGSFTLKGQFQANKAYHITIVNTLGQKLYHTTLNPASTSIHISPNTDLAPGLYFLSVQEEGNKPQTVRFLVK